VPAPSLLYRSASEHLRDWQVQRLGIMHALPSAGLISLLKAAPDHHLQQHFREHALALQSMGYTSDTALQGMFDLILINPSKNRQQTLGWIAEALSLLHADGRIMLCAENQHGAKGLESHIREITDDLSSFSKAKCRCMSFRAASINNPELVEQWRQQSAVSVVPGSGLHSQPGLFSWDQADKGSELLLQFIPASLRGAGMDLCCGNGFLAHDIARRSPDIHHLHMVDHDRLALACAESNLVDSAIAHTCHWLDATTETLPQSLDWIVCNPPFHQHQQQNVELGQVIIQRACAALKRGGQLWIVANRKLPYEHVLSEKLGKVEILSQQQGYKIMHGVRS